MTSLSRRGQRKLSSRELKDLAALALLVVLPCVWWSPLLLGRLPNFMDVITHTYPLRMGAAMQLREGILPLWMPSVFSGTPLAANPQLATWYPPQLLFYLFPGAFTFGLLLALHYIWGGIGSYLYVRRLTGSIGGALFAAFTFQFSAMLVSRIALTPHVYSVVWVPWLFLAIEMARREKGWLAGKGALLLAVLYSLQIYAGAPQISYYTALMLPIYWIVRVLVTTSSNRTQALGRAIVQGVTAALIAILLSGAQILPTMELLHLAERAPIDIERLQGQALNDGFIWRSFIGFTGNPIEDTDSINAIGVGAIILAVIALFRRRTLRVSGVLWLLGALGFILSLGVLVPFWSKLLPLYDGFHAPRRALIFWTICGSLASGVGAALIDATFRRKRWPRWGFVILLLFMTAGTWWMLFRLERVFVSPEHLEANPSYLNAIGDDRYLTLDPTFAYSYDSRREGFGESMIADLAPLHGVHQINGYDPLVLKRYGFARQVACANSGVFYPSHGVFFSDPNSTVLKLLNTQYLIGRYDLYEPSRVIPGTKIDASQLRDQLVLITDDEYWPLFRYKEERPLAWAVESLLSADNAEEALFFATRTDPYRVAYSEEGLAFQSNTNPPRLHAHHRNGRAITVELDEPAAEESFVCVSTVWMPGWRARAASGDLLECFPVNGLIIGVLIPPGTESFEVEYSPASFSRGTLMTVAGTLFWILLWIRHRRRSF